MNVFRKLSCRLYQTIFKIVMPLLPYRVPTILNNYQDLLKVIEEQGCDNVFIVTDNGVVKNHLMDKMLSVFDDNGMVYSVFDKTQVNPTVKNVYEAVEQYKTKNIFKFNSN